jgi:hypothetical protein
VSRSAISIGFVLTALSLLAGAGCETMRQARKVAPAAAPAEFRSTEIDYVDSDAFDLVFETALVKRDAAITIRTPNERPDWTGRLNAWIAAWNMGKGADGRRVRGQFPFAGIDGEALREFRLLVNSVVDRADDAAKISVNWFREERTRAYRVELLKPYSLRFHMHADGKIHIIFFHGDYVADYQRFLSTLTDCDDSETWSRTIIGISRCKKNAEVVQN